MRWKIATVRWFCVFSQINWVYFKDYKEKTGKFMDLENFNKWDPCIIRYVLFEVSKLLSCTEVKNSFLMPYHS